MNGNVWVTIDRQHATPSQLDGLHGTLTEVEK